MKQKRNIGMHTSAEEASLNILRAGVAAGATHARNLMAKSQMGFNAFPAYDFQRPQGAAFAVAKIVRDLEDKKLLAWWSDRDYDRRGHYVTLAGVEAAALNQLPKETT